MKSAFSRTFTAVAVILLTALVLVGISFQILVRNLMTTRAVNRLKQDAQVLVELVEAYYSNAPISGKDLHVALTVATAVSGSDAVICDAHGKLLLCADEPLGCQHQGLILSSDYLTRTFQSGYSVDTGKIDGLYDEARYMVALPIMSRNNAPLGIVLVSSPIDSSLEVLSRITEIFVFVSVLVVVVAMIIMTIFARKQAKPLKTMATAARAFGHGQLNARVDTQGHYSQEMEELALAFNNMASSLQKSEYQRQEFIANVSHELKTPMTTISGYVDGILDGTIPQEKSRQYLHMVSEETKRLSRLVRNMLDISRLQDQKGLLPDQLSRFDISDCLGQVLISFEQRITEKQLDVQVELPELPVYVQACRDQITQVIYNLVDNAIKFNPAGGTLALSVKTGGGKAYICVTNDGETIPPEELSLVFDRFHKLDKSRSENRDSWGLGLYIVKTIIDSHEENISVTSRDGKTAFTFTLTLVN